ncbi:unnamed protein product [Polarella glacialis]|uniref:Uncharacterized protein n=1 Tax=Polarella glacialis TaxID=89957 RepID=A0A813JKF6_POLGL|nr:unnamed protein product [Polarella glacialis]
MVGPSIPFDTRFNVQRRHQITTCGTIVEVMIIKHVDPASNLLLTTEAAAEHSEEAAAEHIEAYASSVVLRVANALAVADDDVEAPLAEEAPASPAAPASVAVEEDAEEAPPAPVVVEEEAEVAGPAPTILEEDAEEAPPAPVAVEEEAEVAAPAPAILEEDAEEAPPAPVAVEEEAEVAAPAPAILEEDAEEAPPAPVAVEEEAEVAAPAPAILEEDAEEAPPAPVTVEEEAEVAAPAPAILEEDAEEAPPAPVAVEEEAKVAAPAPAILEEDAEEAPPAPVAVEEEAEVAAPALAILEEDAEEAPPAPVAVEEEAEVAAPAPAILEEDAEEAPPAPVAVEEAAEVAAPAPVEEEAEEANPAPAIEEDAEEAPASPGAASSTKAGGSSMRDRVSPAEARTYAGPSDPSDLPASDPSDLREVMATVSQYTELANNLRQKGQTSRAIRMMERAVVMCQRQEHGHPAVAVEAARARVNLGAALSEGFRHQEALVAIKEAQKGLSQVLTWASDCNPDDSGVGAIAHEARALRCAALVAEAIQLELCPAEARSGPSPMVQMAAEAERLGGHPMALESLGSESSHPSPRSPKSGGRLCNTGAAACQIGERRGGHYPPAHRARSLGLATLRSFPPVLASVPVLGHSVPFQLVSGRAAQRRLFLPQIQILSSPPVPSLGSAQPPRQSSAPQLRQVRARKAPLLLPFLPKYPAAFAPQEVEKASTSPPANGPPPAQHGTCCCWV